MSRTVAAVDCGTNSIRLLVARCEDDGTLSELTRRTRLARLGQAVDATGEFHPDALERTFAVLDEYAAAIRDSGAEKVRFVATSATRDVGNRTALEEGVMARLRVPTEVISGDEEARLSAAGVLGGIETARPTLILDIGGGSTELVVVGEDRRILSAVSLDLGAVRLKERLLLSEPPTPDEQAAARAHIAAQLDASGVEFTAVASAVGVAGSVTSVAAHSLGLVEYSREAVHGLVLSRAVIDAASRRWLGQTSEEIAQDPLMHPLRAAVIGAGSMILTEIAHRIPGGQVVVSETDILDGIVSGLLDMRD